LTLKSSRSRISSKSCSSLETPQAELFLGRIIYVLETLVNDVIIDDIQKKLFEIDVKEFTFVLYLSLPFET
jgi:hypothetical protein